MFSSNEMLKSHIDYRMEDVRKTAMQCKKRRKKNKTQKTASTYVKGDAKI